MAHWSPPFGTSAAPGPGHSWSRWSSLVRLAVWGGDARCRRCGSDQVRRAPLLLPPWKRVLGLDPCRCDSCGETFNVPRRAATADLYEVPPDEPMPELTLPAPPEVDLAALDKAMAGRLPRRPPTK